MREEFIKNLNEMIATSPTTVEFLFHKFQVPPDELVDKNPVVVFEHEGKLCTSPLGVLNGLLIEAGIERIYACFDKKGIVKRFE